MLYASKEGTCLFTVKNYLLYFFVFALCAALLPLAPTVFPIESKDDAQTVRVLSADTGQVREMPTEDCVLGILQSMALPYEGETLCAAAVAVRSRLLYCEQNRPVHPDAAVCDDPNCCTAFACDSFDPVYVQAAAKTAGICVLYRGKPAAAMMHESSGDYTAGSQSIYGVSLPYLVEVENVKENVKEEHTWDKQTFLSLLGLSADTDLSSLLIGYDRSHRIHTVETDGVSIDGDRFASLLSLPSRCIDLTVTGTEVHAVCYGKGDGVGMSLNGAQMLESTGADYQTILAFYYPDTQIGKPSR